MILGVILDGVRTLLASAPVSSVNAKNTKLPGTTAGPPDAFGGVNIVMCSMSAAFPCILGRIDTEFEQYDIWSQPINPYC